MWELLLKLAIRALVVIYVGGLLIDVIIWVKNNIIYKNKKSSGFWKYLISQDSITCVLSLSFILTFVLLILGVGMLWVLAQICPI